MSPPPDDGGRDDRSIVHINITDFMAQAEETKNPALRGRPFAVGNPAAARAVLLGVSRTAYAEGIRPGMDIRRAVKLLKELKVVPPDPDLYRSADSEISRIIRTYTPLAEEVRGGHCFLDLRGTRRLFGRAEDCASRIRSHLVAGTGLRASVALATNKLVSKVGSRVVKPYGFATIRPGEEKRFLEPQEIGLLPGVGEKLRERFSLLMIDTAGEFADFSDEEARVIGPQGVFIRDRARGIDPRGLDLTPLETRSLSGLLAFEEDTNDAGEISRRLALLAGDLGFRLRGEDLETRRAALTANYTDGMRITARENLPQGTFRDTQIAAAAGRLLGRLLERRVRLRSIRLELFDLRPARAQLDLFLPGEDEKKSSVQGAVDRMNRKFGFGAVRVCAALGG